MACRRKWSAQSMEQAVSSVKNEGKGLREASRLYDVPVETLRRRVNGLVEMDCRPGPATVLLKEEEDQIYRYLLEMCDMGFGVGRETVMRIAFVIAEKTHKRHPFTGETAGRAWFEGFCRRYPNLTIRTPQPLSYSRATAGNPEVIRDFFGKLGALFGRLNLLSKPAQVFNADETGITVVHKPGKVLAEVGRRHVYSIVSGEKGRTHTILACTSASGYVLPPLMIFPRKRAVPDKLKNGAVPNTLFTNSSNGWITSDIYLQWLHFFCENIPPIRPILLIVDGHSSHLSIEAIEFAKANSIHILCLPSHTTHILQPLDIGVFKSFKSHFSKACTKYIVDHPGRVITPEILPSMVAEAWPLSFTQLNVMSGFRKSGIFPLNPSMVDDRCIAPSKVFQPQSTNNPPLVQSASLATEGNNEDGSDTESSDSSEVELFTTEQEQLFKKRFEEGYDLKDPHYIAWLKINHADRCLSVDRHLSVSSTAGLSESSNSASGPIPKSVSITAGLSESSNEASGPISKSPLSSDLSEVLVLPSAEHKQKRKGLNSKAVCITDILDELKLEETEKAEKKKLLEERRKEREQKRKEKAEKLEEKRKEKEEKKKQREEERKRKEEDKKRKVEEKKRKEEERKRKEEKRKEEKKEQGSDNEDTSDVCPKCGVLYGTTDSLWICCDACDSWLDFKCSGLKSDKKIPSKFVCKDCKR